MLLAFWGGPADWVIIFILALMLLGPKKLPEVGKQLAQALREFRKIADDLTGTVNSVRDDVLGATSSVRDEVTGITRSVHLEASNALKPSVPGVQSSLENGAQRFQQRPIDQSAEDLMAPVVAEQTAPSRGLQLSTLPPSTGDQGLDAKGQ